MKVAILVVTLIFATACTTGAHELGRAANPQSVLINAPRACAGVSISDEKIREFCLQLAKLEKERSETAVKAISDAIAAGAKAQAERYRLLAENPCAGGWFMAPSFCYGGPNGTFDGGAAYRASRGGRWN